MTQGRRLVVRQNSIDGTGHDREVCNRYATNNFIQCIIVTDYELTQRNVMLSPRSMVMNQKQHRVAIEHVIGTLIT
jgi:hypothetical protein